MSGVRRGLLHRLRRRRAPGTSAPDPASLVDVDWYALQTGRGPWTADAAWEHYRREGRHALLSPHPLFVPADDGGDASPFEQAAAAAPGSGPRPFPGLLRPAAPDLFRDLDDDTRLALTTIGGDRPVPWADLRPHWRRNAEAWTAAARLDPPSWSPEPPTTPATPPPSGTTVSVVLATWNRAEPLVRAIASVQHQTHSAWQLLVVDDGSDDDTRDVVQDIAARDDRVRLVARPHLGVSAARNAGLRAADGRLVAFLDSDNTWEPDHLAHVVHAFDTDPSLESAYSVLAREQDGRREYRTVQVDHAVLRVRNHVDLNVLVARADVVDAVGGFDESLRRCVDYDLVLRLAARRAPLLVPVVGSLYDSDPDADRITTRESPTWPELVRLRHNVDWPAKRREERTAGVSLVLPVDRDTSALTDVLEAAREAFADVAWEAVVVDSTSSPRLAAALATAAVVEPGLRYVRRPLHTTWPVGACLGAMQARHDVLLVVGQGHVLDAASLRALAHRARLQPRAVVQPVVAKGDVVVSLGADLRPGDEEPTVLRPAVHVDDLAGLDEAPEVPACHALVLATGTSTFAELEGVDPLMGPAFGLLDLSLRGRAAGVPSVVATRAVARRRVGQATVGPHPATRTELLRRHGHDGA